MKRKLLFILLIVSFVCVPTLKAEEDIFEWGEFDVFVEYGEDLQIVLNRVKEGIKLKKGYSDPDFYVENNYVNYTTQSSINTNNLKKYRLDHRAVSPKYKKNEIRSYYFHVVDIEPPKVISSVNFIMAYGRNKPDYSLGLLITDNVTETTEIKVIIDDSNVNYTQIGFYEILYTIIDSSGNKILYTETLEIVDKIKPTIKVKKPLVHQVKETFLFDEYFSVTDNYSENINIEYTFAGDLETLGEVKITVLAVDESGNQSEYIGEFLVVDEVSPTISLDEESITIEIGEKIDLLAFVSDISDNYDELSIDDLIVTTNINYDQTGSYVVIYELQDNSNNETKATLEVLIKDLTPPEIIVSDLEFNQNDEVDLLLYAKVTDNYSKPEDIGLKIVYNDVDFTEPGVYSLIYQAVDESGQHAHKTITVTINGTTNEQKTFYIVLGAGILGIIGIIVYQIKKKKDSAYN